MTLEEVVRSSAELSHNEPKAVAAVTENSKNNHIDDSSCESQVMILPTIDSLAIEKQKSNSSVGSIEINIIVADEK